MDPWQPTLSQNSQRAVTTGLLFKQNTGDGSVAADECTYK